MADVGPGTRTLEINDGSTFAFMLNAFVGVEYFILPKISLGAEYTWGLWIMSMGTGDVTTETYDGSSTTETTTDGTEKTFGLWLDTGLAGEIPHESLAWGGASLRAIFHF